MKLRTPRIALGHAAYLAQMGPPDTWAHEVPSIRRTWLKNAGKTIRALKTLGFEVIERRTQKVKRRKKGSR